MPGVVQGAGCDLPSLFNLSSSKGIQSFLFSFKDVIYLFLEREEGRKKGREKHQWASRPSPTGTWPSTQAGALPGNRTSDHLICRPALNPLSHTSQGSSLF